MIKLSNPFHHLCIRVDNEVFDVVAMFQNADVANKFLAATPDCGVMDIDKDGTIYICRHKADGRFSLTSTEAKP